MTTKNIVFVDARVSHYASLIDGLADTDEVFLLDGESDGLTQMVAALQGLTGFDAIHVISHGSQGALVLGSTVLDGGNLAAYRVQLADIGSALSAGGDILLYGCHVAQGEAGLQFITTLADLTGADVAASDDATGAAALGGDWVLEQSWGTSECPVLVSDSFNDVLAANTAPTFVVRDGKVTLDGGYGLSIAVQGDGQILTGGGAGIFRFAADGALDASFHAYFDISTVAAQLTGKVLVTGNIYGAGIGNSIGLARYTASGSLDTTFGTNGQVRTELGTNGTITSSTVQSDGKILVAGYDINGNGDFMILRYSPDGILDANFGQMGKVTVPIGSNSDFANAIIQQPDGKIIVVGQAYFGNNFNSDFGILRLNIDGSVDTGFGNSGIVGTDLGSDYDVPRSVVVQSDGKILVAGTSNFAFALVRYNIDGSKDTNFGSNGELITDLGSSNYGGRGLILQVDGKIVVTGDAFNPATSSGVDFALARYGSDGRLDETFGLGGKVWTDFGKYDEGMSAVLQSDNKILVAGVTQNNGKLRLALARYNTDGSIDGTYSPPESTLGASPTYTEDYSALVLDPDVQILDTELASTGNYNGSTLTLQRHGAASPQVVFSAASSALTILTTDSYFAIDSVTIGRVTSNSVGILILTFNANATQSLVNKAMQQIAYANSSDAPPASVQIDWTFNDGNTGAQGTGGAMSVTGSTTVEITATNDAPVLNHSLVDQSLSANTPFSYTFPADAFTDPDQETLSYSIRMNDGTGVPPWLTFSPATRTFSGTPGVADAGELDIVVTATDSANATASYTVRLSVSATPVADTTAPTVTTFSPADEATNVAVSGNILVTFSEVVQPGTGNIVLKTAAGATVATYDAATSTNLSIEVNPVIAIYPAPPATSTLTINPSNDLAAGTTYLVEFAAGSIQDLAGNPYAGSSDYNFTTAAAVVIPNPKDNDFIAAQFASPSVLGAGVGDDTYLLSNTLLLAGKTITLSDTAGANSIQLAAGLSIKSSKVMTNTLQLTLSNDSVINVLGADNFTYEVGGNSTVGINQTDASYTSFVQNTLGVTMPTGGAIAAGGALVIGGGAAAPIGAAQSADDNFVIAQTSSPSVLGAGAGNDSYLLSGPMLSAGKTLTLSDTVGSNSIQLAAGLSIKSCKVMTNTLQLTMDNDSVVNVLGADKFSYEAGGNSTTGINQTDISYASFVASILGLTMPTGSAIASGGALVIGDFALPPSPTLFAVTLTGAADLTLANEWGV